MRRSPPPLKTAPFLISWLGFSVGRGTGNVLFAVHIGQKGASRDHMDCRALGAEAAQEPGRRHGHRRLCRWVDFPVLADSLFLI
jgi:hypothetical protein